jgi:hypothetical protein
MKQALYGLVREADKRPYHEQRVDKSSVTDSKCRNVTAHTSYA